MAGSLTHVARGDKFRVAAGDWNAILDSARLSKMDAARSPRTVDPQALRAGEILVKNSTGGDRSRFDIVGLASASVFDPATALAGFQQMPALVAALPTTATYFGRWGVLLEPIVSGGLGRAVAAGTTYAKVQVDQTWHQRCDVTNSSSAKLTSCPQGAGEILWRESGTGEKWAIVRIGDVLEVILDSKAPSAWSTTQTKTCAIYRATSATTWTQSVTFEGWVGGSESISSGKNIRIRWSRDSNAWVIHEADCE